MTCLAKVNFRKSNRQMREGQHFAQTPKEGALRAAGTGTRQGCQSQLHICFLPAGGEGMTRVISERSKLSVYRGRAPSPGKFRLGRV